VDSCRHHIKLHDKGLINSHQGGGEGYGPGSPQTIYFISVKTMTTEQFYISFILDCTLVKSDNLLCVLYMTPLHSANSSAVHEYGRNNPDVSLTLRVVLFPAAQPVNKVHIMEMTFFYVSAYIVVVCVSGGE